MISTHQLVFFKLTTKYFQKIWCIFSYAAKHMLYATWEYFSLDNTCWKYIVSKLGTQPSKWIGTTPNLYLTPPLSPNIYHDEVHYSRHHLKTTIGYDTIRSLYNILQLKIRNLHQYLLYSKLQIAKLSQNLNQEYNYDLNKVGMTKGVI